MVSEVGQSSRAGWTEAGANSLMMAQNFVLSTHDTPMVPVQSLNKKTDWAELFNVWLLYD